MTFATVAAEASTRHRASASSTNGVASLQMARNCARSRSGGRRSMEGFRCGSTLRTERCCRSQADESMQMPVRMAHAVGMFVLVGVRTTCRRLAFAQLPEMPERHGGSENHHEQAHDEVTDDAKVKRADEVE